MAYDPFERGRFPVGVRTENWHDERRDRALTVEIWYPARDEHRGQDLDAGTQDAFTVDGMSGSDGSRARQAAVRDAGPRTEAFHVVLLVHGYAGHRRESTFMGTHLASHGFLVVSADHAGSTYKDIVAVMDSARAEDRRLTRAGLIPDLLVDRKGDVPFLFDQAVARLGAEPTRMGITGASMGGWTSVMAPDVEPRIAAIAPMCPSGGETPVYPRGENHARDALDFDWKSDVAALFMVADRDSWLPLFGLLELFGRVPGAKRMVILRRADHQHFVDDIAYGHEFLRDFTRSLADIEAEGGVDWGAIAATIAPYDELCPGDRAQLCWRGVCAAHMEARIKRSAEASDFLDGDLVGELAKRGIDAEQIWRREGRSAPYEQGGGPNRTGAANGAGDP